LKIAPVSADLLIKLALLASAVGVVAYGYKKITGSVSGAIDSVTGLPGRAWDATTAATKEGGTTWQDRITPNPPASSPDLDYFGKYRDPLINNAGMDFGNLSG
jgi:hypothetical protein